MSHPHKSFSLGIAKISSDVRELLKYHLERHDARKTLLIDDIVCTNLMILHLTKRTFLCPLWATASSMSLDGVYRTASSADRYVFLRILPCPKNNLH